MAQPIISSCWICCFLGSFPDLSLVSLPYNIILLCITKFTHHFFLFDISSSDSMFPYLTDSSCSYWWVFLVWFRSSFLNKTVKIAITTIINISTYCSRSLGFTTPQSLCKQPHTGTGWVGGWRFWWGSICSIVAQSRSEWCTGRWWGRTESKERVAPCCSQTHRNQ